MGTIARNAVRFGERKPAIMESLPTAFDGRMPTLFAFIFGVRPSPAGVLPGAPMKKARGEPGFEGVAAWPRRIRCASGQKKVLATTYFPTVKTAVSSALEGLTSEFGMESGVTPPPRSPGQNSRLGLWATGMGFLLSHCLSPMAHGLKYKFIEKEAINNEVKTHGLLVPVS
jgi:hypothetical protein